jgi:hypothetical protein
MKILVCVGLVMVGRGGGSAAVVTMVFLFFLFVYSLPAWKSMQPLGTGGCHDDSLFKNFSLSLSLSLSLHSKL